MRMQRWSLFATAVMALQVAIQPVCAGPDDRSSRDLLLLTELLEDTGRIELADKLLINLDASARLIVPDKCEKAGEIELKSLAATAEVEEAYAFLPSLCLWIEVGREEAMNRTLIDFSVVERLSAEFSLVILYHTHTGLAQKPAGYFPAYRDLIVTLLSSSEFSRLPGRIKHRAASPLGVFEYEFVPTQETYRLKERMERTGLGDYVVENLAYFYATSSHREQYYTAVRSCRKMTDGDPNRLDECFPMVLENFILRYRH